ncbi:PAS domain-containing sensor histidine kinase [Nocardioides marmoraquaticus]
MRADDPVDAGGEVPLPVVRRPARPTALVSAGVVLTGVIAVLVGDGVVASVVAQLLGAAACVPAAVLCTRAARASGGRTSAAWRALSVAAGLWAAGIVVTVVSVVLPGRGIWVAIYPFQGLAMVLMLAALLLLPRPPWRAGDAVRAWLDGSVLVLSVALAGALTVLPDVVAGSAGVERVFAIAYPTAALAMLGLAYALGRRHVYPPRPEAAMLSAAIGAWLVGASGYALDPTALLAPPWVSWAVAVGTVLLALAARRAVSADDPELGSRVARVVLAVPEVAVVVVAAVAVVVGVESPAARALLAAVVAAVVVRHVVAASDSRRFHWRLQREVADRTVELRDWSQRYATILDTVGDGIVSTDARGRISFANAAALRLLGAGRDDLVGRDACEALCTVHSPDCPFAAAHRGEVLDGVATELRVRGGAVVPVELSAAPQPRGEGEGGGAVLAFRDVSARVAVEQVKRQFVSSVSHELRTPLSSVRGVLEMMVDGDAGELTPSGHDLVANASRGVERLSRLVDDIIDAEKLATGQFRMQRTRTSLVRVLHETVTQLEPLAAGAEVRIVLGEVGSTEVWGDSDRIEQALVNLVGNAVKFSPPGGTVEVTVRHDGDPEGMVTITVRDQGPGLPADQLEHVFERFHQVTAGTATDKGGTGLGLTITRSIVQQHGGRTWVESVLGQGAAFSFTLPVAAPASCDPR